MSSATNSKTSANSKNIIAIPFAFEKDMNTGVNVSQSNALGCYLQSVCVAAASAKYHNPECTVAVVTNLEKNDFPSGYREVLSKHNVEIMERPFDRFRFPSGYRWSLAFYKLCALSYLSEMGFDNICYLDADVFVQGSLDEAWKECSGRLLLFDIKHGSGEIAPEFMEEIKAFLKTEKPENPVHYGGEFFLGDKSSVKCFLELANEVFEKMINESFVTNRGDEFILCIAAMRMTDRIKSTSKYIRRFWTSWHFRMISHAYHIDPVAILHLPDEKNDGLLTLYRNYIVKGAIPENSIVWKKCHLKSLSFKNRVWKLRASLSGKR